MDVRELLEKVKSGEMSVEAGTEELKNLPYEDLGYAKLDLHRELRSGFPETVFCQGKRDEFFSDIYIKLYEKNGRVLGTRASEHEYDPVSRVLKVCPEKMELKGNIAVCTGGTADIPVAEEAAQTAEFFGCYVNRIYDVGVAGIHRILSRRDEIVKANCIVAVAGMEGALGTVIAGLVRNPVIAVPTSVGYGASFGGISALLTMLNSCANGISTVNIDNGYGAGYLAAQINRLAVEK